MSESDSDAQQDLSSEELDRPSVREPTKKPLDGWQAYHRVTVDEDSLLKNVKSKSYQEKLKKELAVAETAARRLKMSEVLLTEQGGILEPEDDDHPTWKFTQDAISEMVDLGTREKLLDLSLEGGPFSMDFTPNGRNLLFAGRRGNVALLDLERLVPHCEFHVRETVRDVKTMHGNGDMFALAQRKYVCIYDRKGAEVHRLRDCMNPTHLDYLPYHFLLTHTDESNSLKYQDVSVGNILCEKRLKAPATCLRHNPWNAVVNVGDANGLVTMWTPNMEQPVVQLKAHRGRIAGVCNTWCGQYLVTAGHDNLVKVFDMRNQCKEVQRYVVRHTPHSLDVSHRGVIGVANGPVVDTWHNGVLGHASKYVVHRVPHKQKLSSVRFRPFEDFLFYGSAQGIASMIVPGSAIANVDSVSMFNPYDTKKMKREKFVKALLDKVPASLICLDPSTIGQIDESGAALQELKSTKMERVVQAIPAGKPRDTFIRRQKHIERLHENKPENDKKKRKKDAGALGVFL